MPVQATSRIPVIALGMSLGLFLAVTFILCVGLGLLFPDRAMSESWLRLLPGFIWPSFFLGPVRRPGLRPALQLLCMRAVLIPCH
ncbi:hypothetical protein [Halomonas sp.]|uniref:hypothetical protein n=1 Tax=Halomonas sp. TaxID=1486246 RepID=UPI0035653D6B